MSVPSSFRDNKRQFVSWSLEILTQPIIQELLCSARRAWGVRPPGPEPREESGAQRAS